MLSLMPTATGTLAGKVVDDRGEPIRSASVAIAKRFGAEFDLLGLVSLYTTPDGTFRGDGLPIGDYVLRASSNSASALYSRASVTISTDSGTTPILLSLQPLPLVRGVIRFEGSEPPPTRQGIAIVVRSLDPSAAIMTSGAIRFHIDESGRFEASHPGGLGVIVAPRMTAGWALKRASIGNTDLADRPFNFGYGDVDGVEIVLTSRVGSIVGTLEDRGQPVFGAAVLVCSQDRARWSVPERGCAVSRTSRDGAFAMKDLLPGDYLAFATTSFSGTEAAEPWIASKRSQATPVTVVEGRAASVRLTTIVR
jgi:hypothetical protein